MRVDGRRGVDCQMLGGSELITIAVHAPLFHEHARATLGPAYFDAKPADRFALKGPRTDLNRRLLALLEQGMNESERLREAQYGRVWEHQVLDAWLGDVATPDPGISFATRYRAAREAEVYLRAHRDRRVSIAELCGATGVPRRTLMLGFCELFGIPPAAYHRRMRLSAARRDLVRSWADETSVTTIALRWGFDHFGRFAGDYRRMFGESPNDTLRGCTARSKARFTIVQDRKRGRS
jgi:AraC-like DNA-binding protein